ncbi:MAG: flippase-like domain-containing protein [Betaproteobacteria bacterium]|nr:flippase-like domain-containing protein [Betaproteobacteria bacterium]
MLRSIDSDELLRTLGSASLNWVAMALCHLLGGACAARQVRTILQPVHGFLFQVASSLLVRYSANNVLPARLGELFRADFHRTPSGYPAVRHQDDFHRAPAGHGGSRCLCRGRSALDDESASEPPRRRTSAGCWSPVCWPGACWSVSPRRSPS